MDNIRITDCQHVDQFQLNRDCLNELLNLMQEFYQYNKEILSWTQLRQVPSFDEGFHLSLLLKAFNLMQKCESQLASFSTPNPRPLISAHRHSDGGKHQECVESTKQMSNISSETPAAASSFVEKEQVSLATHVTLSEDLGFVSPSSEVSTETVKNTIPHSEWNQTAPNNNQISDLTSVQDNVGTLVRKNERRLRYNVMQKNPKYSHAGIVQYIDKEYHNDQGIIYCHQDSKEVSKLVEGLEQVGIKVCRFSNIQNEERWSKGEMKVLVCVSNFPKAPICQELKFFIYAALPVSMNSYRNKLQLIVPSKEDCIVDCTIFYSRFDRYKFGSFFKDDNGKMKKKLQKLYDVVSFCEGSSCRKLVLMGTKCQPSSSDSCDNCFDQVDSFQMIDVTKKARSILKKLTKIGGQTVSQIAASGRKEEKEIIFKILNQLIFNGYLKEVHDTRFYPKTIPTQKGHDAIADLEGFQIMIEYQKTSGSAEYEKYASNNLDEEAANPQKKRKLQATSDEDCDDDFDDDDDEMELSFHNKHHLQRFTPSRALESRLGLVDSDSDS